jgi:hypothetical protein
MDLTKGWFGWVMSRDSRQETLMGVTILKSEGFSQMMSVVMGFLAQMMVVKVKERCLETSQQQ